MATVPLFESRLTALRHANRDERIFEPSPRKIHAMLGTVRDGWAKVKRARDDGLAREGTGQDAMAMLPDHATKTLKDMNETVRMYENI